ncbi:helix-turn-helix transcriptional regulator [Phenylobacterium sp. LjRoot225]|uniref:helix-turn-helix transcriptional regulator n=1 Tax=Phenylobacterium sp. LjRoot225 TaxID=3342285 RepID=UPI003ED0B686
MPSLFEPQELTALRDLLSPGPPQTPAFGCQQSAALLQMYAPGARPRPGAVCSDELDVDSHWHFHDMHQLLFAFEGAVELEGDRGRHLIPRQVAAWIPAGAPHRASIHRVRSGSIFFTVDMVRDPETRIRTVTVSALMREMMREAMRWPLQGPDGPLRTSFFKTMAGLCSEWIEREADLFLPTSNDPRLTRALDVTARRADLKLSDVSRHAGMSERSLRRHLKAETGMTWEAYRQRSRLLQAVSLLSETDGTIVQIAATCGFESPSAFAKAFRVAMGEVPSAYRNRVTGTPVDR